MKIISFETETHQGIHDLRIFFELTNTEYNKLVNMEFSDAYEMYQHCESVCVGYYNDKVFSENDELRLTGGVLNHTDQVFITPEYSFK